MGRESLRSPESLKMVALASTILLPHFSPADPGSEKILN
jgi:hypothetical protein